MSEVASFALQQLDCVACMMRQCTVLLKNKNCHLQRVLYQLTCCGKYVIDSDVDFPYLMKRTPIIDMPPNTTADMVNADCVHNKWLDALCL